MNGLVTADIENSAGEAVRLRAKYLVGTDGGRSTVRKIAGVEMSGATAPMKLLSAVARHPRRGARR